MKGVRTFVSELRRLAELYRQELSEALIAVYCEAMAEYPVCQVVSACRRHVRDPERGSFFPLPADLIRLIDGTRKAQAFRAWTVADQAMRDVGQYRSVQFGDTRITAVIMDLGGWDAFGERWVSRREAPYLAKEFVDRYADLLARGEMREVGYLPGRCELANRLNGWPYQPPVLVGGVSVLPQREIRAVPETV